MLRKTLLFGSLIAGLAVAAAVITDVLVTTDEERLEEFVDAITGEVESHRIDYALRYANPTREPVEIDIDGRSLYYDEGDEMELSSSAHDYLNPYLGQDVDVLQKHVEIQNEAARVDLRIATDTGLVNLHFKLRRHRDGWFVHRVQVS